jgi:N-acetyl-anhydromuramyl-L-alanine amidase AmpD
MDKPTLQLGSKGDAVFEWQKICGAGIDGDFGQFTEKATKAWQTAHGLPPDGVVAASTWEKAAAHTATDPAPPPDGLYPFIQAANYTKGRIKKITGIVIHTMENTEKPGNARGVALWFAGTQAPKASAHYCVDSVDVIQCVRDSDTAWHAPGANANGIGIEHAGRAAQSDADWQDEFSQKMLVKSAKLVAHLCKVHGIPAVRLSPAELAAGGSGIFGHKDCTDAFKTKGGHVDPGPHFPWTQYIDMVKGHLNES